jgi:vitamin B12 transporter
LLHLPEGGTLSRIHSVVSIILSSQARRYFVGAFLLVVLLTPLASFAASPAVLRGVVSDPLGAVVAGARIELVQSATKTHGVKVLQSTTADALGNYSFSIPAAGRYSVRAMAPTFQATTSAAVFLSGSEQALLNVTLATATRTDEVTVTATGTPTPEAQLGAAVTLIGAEEYRNQTEVQDPLRHVPGVQITQVGQVGGTTGLSIRGGNTNANKVMIDGVPADDIGGAVEFANLATVGVDQIEVLREPNSALYGSDALAGVVSMTTTRGTTPLPLLTYTGDAGNFGSYRNQITGGGVYKGFDYYSAFGRVDTRNNLPNDEFHNGTYAGNFGLALNPENDLRFTVRHLDVSGGQPNAILLYGIPDDAAQKEQDTYLSAAWNNQATSRWHNEIRYGGLRLRSQFYDFAYTGIPDPAGSGNYLGNVMTINGANGYSVTGQAIFQYAGTYPSEYVTATDRDFVYAQTDYRVNKHLTALGGFKYEAERGTTDTLGTPSTSISRGNYSYMMQLAGDLGNRLYYTLGSGLEDNGLFGFAATPRASLAYYLARPSSRSLLSGTKLHGSFGKGIKEPSIYYQANSLYGLLSAQPDGSQTIAQYGISPIGPEESRTFDGGVEQEIAGGRARLGVTYFHNEFTNGVEFVPPGALVALGLSGANLDVAQGGAAVNSLAYRAQGVEVETEYKISQHLFARGGYTYTDAVVQRSFATYGEPATYNTASNFPTVQIGAFSPLVGARPFRVAPHTGYFGLNYTRSKFYGSVTGTMVGRRDDSDFLYDVNYGTSLLLPNRNLDGAYQRLDLSSGYQFTRMLETYLEAQNVLSEHYAEAFGYPALPLTFRAGLKITFGGESWRTK